MILVYFLNGETATMPTATHARAEPFATDGTGSTAYPGITCLDAEGREVGRFRVTEITGYVIAHGQEEDDLEPVMHSEPGGPSRKSGMWSAALTSARLDAGGVRWRCGCVS